MKRLLLFLAVLFPLITFAQDFVIDHFDIKLVVEKDGSIEVNEIIDVTFSKKKRGIYREIPYSYNINGKKMNLGVTGIQVTGEKHKVSRKNGHHVIRIGNKNKYVTGKQQYNIRYKIRNGVQSYATHQELYYDLIGDRWNADISKLTYEVQLPKSSTFAESDLKSTTGRKGTIVDGLTIRQERSDLIAGSSNRDLPIGEGATIAIKFPTNYLTVAELAANGYRQELEKKRRRKANEKPLLVLIPLGLFGLFGYFRKLIGKGRAFDGPQRQYSYPPDGLTSAHVGAYIDQTAHTRDVVSLIPYWATEGFLRMDKVDDDTKVTRLKALDSDFPSYEHLVFDKIFELGDQRLMSDLMENFYTTLNAVKSQLTEEVKAQGYYNERFSYWFRSWRLVLFPLLMVAIAAVAMIVFGQMILGFSCLGLGFASLLFAIGRYPLSEYGAEMKEQLDGLRRFMENVPEEEVADLIEKDPNYFEKMLPFAVAFGLDKEFIPKFETVMDTPPLWYGTSDGSRSFGSFSSSFDTETISSAFASSPQPSGGGSSGSGGGFSSGGGIGGGGGGSW